MEIASAFHEWTRGERGFLSVVGKTFALKDKRPYYEPVETPSHD
jgi:hypothetical protein